MRPIGRKTVVLGALGSLVLLFIAWTDQIGEEAYAFHSAEEIASIRAAGNGLAGGINNYFRASGQCYGCHGPDLNGYASVDSNGVDVNVSDDWRSTMMANSARDPFWRAKVSHEIQVNPSHAQELEDKCTTCHAPMGNYDKKLSGMGHYSIADLDSDPVGIDGVSCLACHMQSPDSIGQFNSGIIKFDTTLKAYGPYSGMFAAPMISFVGYEPLFGDHIDDGELCASCHTLITETADLAGNLTGGTFVEQATYHEWVNSSYDGTVSCQGCHLPRIDDAIVISANYLFLTGHSPYGLHHMAGANVFMLELLKENIFELQLTADSTQFDSTIARTYRMLQDRSLMVDLSVPARNPDTAFIDVKLTNLAGHKFPSGYPSRRAYVEFVVKDLNGDTLFKSGILQGDYEVEGHDPNWEPHHDIINSSDQVQIYEMVLGDVNGDKTTVLERADEPLKDNRLTPAGFSTGHYAYDTTLIVNVPSSDVDFNYDANGVEGSGSDIVHYHVPMNGYTDMIDVSARVYYQTAPPAWMTEMFSYNSAEIDTFRNMYNDADKNPVLVKEVFLQDVWDNVLEIETLGFRLFPNPAKSGNLNLSGPLDQVNTIQVFGTDGSLITELEPQDSFLNIDLRSGTYIIVLVTERGVSAERVVIL